MVRRLYLFRVVLRCRQPSVSAGVWKTDACTFSVKDKMFHIGMLYFHNNIAYAYKVCGVVFYIRPFRRCWFRIQNALKYLR